MLAYVYNFICGFSGLLRIYTACPVSILVILASNFELHSFGRWHNYEDLYSPHMVVYTP